MNVNDHVEFQNNLQNDFDRLIQSIRYQQDYFLKMMQCINQITNEQEQNQIYIHQDISRYRQILQQVKQVQPSFKQAYSILLLKYSHDNRRYTNSEAFLKRVVYRILQILFSNISLINHKLPIIYQEYVRLKGSCFAIIQQNSCNMPYQLIQIITQYQISKILKYSQLLNYLITHLQNGNIDFLSHLQINLFLEKQIAYQFVIKKQQKRESAFDFTKINKSKPEESELPKVEAKQKVKVSAKIKKVYQIMKDVVDINKAQFTQSLANSKKDQIYKELLLRNKINQKNISQFQSKKRKLQAMPALYNQPTKTLLDNNVIVESKAHKKKMRNNIKIKLTKAKRSNTPFVQHNSLHQTIKQQEQILLKDSDAQTTKDSEQKIQEVLDQKEKVLHIILKRKAFSVDKNYKELPQKNSQMELKVLSNSIKINRLQPIVATKQSNLTPTNSVNSSIKIPQPNQKAIRYTKLCF